MIRTMIKKIWLRVWGWIKRWWNWWVRFWKGVWAVVKSMGNWKGMLSLLITWLAISGSGTTSGKVYKIVPTVVDENIVWTKVEV